MLFIVPCFMVMQMKLSLYSSMLINGGRKERFFTALTLVVAITVLITAVILFLAVLTVLMKPIMPNINLQGHNFAFQAADLRAFFLPLLIVPLGFILTTIFYRQQLLAMAFLVFMVFLVTMHINELESKFDLIYIPVLILLNWIALAVVLYYICSRRSLIGQGRS